MRFLGKTHVGCPGRRQCARQAVHSASELARHVEKQQADAARKGREARPTERRPLCGGAKAEDIGGGARAGEVRTGVEMRPKC